MHQMLTLATEMGESVTNICFINCNFKNSVTLAIPELKRTSVVYMI